MTKFFDAIDIFFDTNFSGLWGLVLTAAFIGVVIALDYMTKTTTAMLLLAVPGIYMMGRSGGIYSLVKFAICMVLVIFVLAAVIAQVPCNDFGRGFRMFYGVTCH